MEKSENFSNNRFTTGGRGGGAGWGENKKKSPSRVDITNDWHYNSTHPICLSSMARDNFTLLFYLHLQILTLERKQTLRKSLHHMAVQNGVLNLQLIWKQTFSTQSI